jgi:hypothetical protein
LRKIDLNKIPFALSLSTALVLQLRQGTFGAKGEQVSVLRQAQHERLKDLFSRSPYCRYLGRIPTEIIGILFVERQVYFGEYTGE